MRVTSKGQVTIPLSIREKLGILPATEVEFVVEGNRVWLRKQKPSLERGRKVIQRMRGRATTGLSTEEIMRLTRSAPSHEAS